MQNKIKHLKKPLYIIITVIFFFCIISLANINVEAPDINNVIKHLSVEEYSTLLYRNCHIESDSGINLFVPDNDDPKVWLPLPEEKFNGIKIQFEPTNIGESPAQLYWAKNGDGLSEFNSVYSVSNLETPSEMLFILPDNNIYTTLRLDIGGTYAIKYLEYGTISNIQYSKSYKLNYSSAIILIVMIVLLIIFDKKIAYFTAIKQVLTREYICLQEKSIIKYKYFLRLISDILKVVYGICFIVMLAIGYITRGSIVTFFILSIILLIVLLVDNIVNKTKSDPAKIFLIISLITCTMYSYCMPINTGISWDDMIHYQHASLFRFMLYGGEQTLADVDLNSRLTKNVDYIESPYDSCLELIYMDKFAQSDYRSTVNPYTHIGYLPVATVMFISDLFNVCFISMIVLSKLFNGIVYSIVIYCGMKRLKSGQYILSSVALMPTCLYLSTVFSYDYWVNTFTMYSIAYLVSELQQPNKPLTATDAVLMLGSMFIGCGPKAIYFALLIPFIFLSKEKFSGKFTHKQYIISIIFTALLIFSSFAVPMLVGGVVSDVRGGENVNGAGQINFILSNLPEYVLLLFKAIPRYCAIGNLNGWFNFYSLLADLTPKDSTVTFICMALCALYDKSKSDNFKNALAFKIITFIALYMQVALICTALYINFTPVGSQNIGGLQGRYLFPLLFPFLYCLGSVHVKTTISSQFMKSIIFGMLSLNLMWSAYSIYIIKLYA